MPRGRHRHEQPLHRLLPPAAVATAALACAGGAWLVGPAGLDDTGTVVLRGLVAAAALAAVTGAVLTRRWDRRAGRRVAELEARRAGMEWRAEERQAEHEAELEEARALRAAVERKLAARRAELGRLRNEHAALLRRYANAETERASALEGRRLLELESAAPARAALTSGAADHRSAAGAPTSLTYLQASEALRHLRRSAERQRRLRAIEGARDVDAAPPSGSASVSAPSAAPAPVAPVAPAAPRRPVGGFDFFGARSKPSGAAARPSGPAPRGDAVADPAGTVGPGEDAEPEPAPRRCPPHHAGNVVDLGADDADALDITELRSALP